MLVTTLCAAEQRIVKWVASQRQSSNGLTREQKQGPQGDDVTDLNGFAGEMAFCKVANIYPDFSVAPRKGGHDCLFHGWRLDVKTTEYDDGDLLVRVTKSPSACDGYVLMVGSFPGPYRVAGWTLASEVCRADRLGDKGHGPTYVMSQRQLRPGYPLSDRVVAAGNK